MLVIIRIAIRIAFILHCMVRYGMWYDSIGRGAVKPRMGLPGLLLAASILVSFIPFLSGCATPPVEGCAVEPIGASVPEGSWSFAVVGDSRGMGDGIRTRIFSRTVEALAADPAGIELVLFLGDLVYGRGKIEENSEELLRWVEMTASLRDAGIRVYPIRGNHDINRGGDGDESWNRVFSGPLQLPQNGPTGEKNLTYSFDHRGCLFIGLDAYREKTPSVNREWAAGRIEEYLSDPAERQDAVPRIFVYSHPPAFEIGHASHLGVDPVRRDAFWDLLVESGVESYFAGHDHFYARGYAGDTSSCGAAELLHFVVGTAGAPLYRYDGDHDARLSLRCFLREYGYLVVTVTPRDVRYRFSTLGSVSGGIVYTADSDHSVR